jgi:hypothetical protein
MSERTAFLEEKRREALAEMNKGNEGDIQKNAEKLTRL